jgi:hypothetical protein
MMVGGEGVADAARGSGGCCGGGKGAMLTSPAPPVCAAAAIQLYNTLVQRREKNRRNYHPLAYKITLRARYTRKHAYARATSLGFHG